MAYSRYATEMKDGDNNIYGLMDEEARAQLSDLNSAFNGDLDFIDKFTEKESTTVSVTYNGKCFNLGGETVDITSPIDLNAYECYVDSCTSGDAYIVSGKGQTNTRVWSFVNANGVILKKSAPNVTVENELLIAPEGSAYFVGNNYKQQYTGSLKKISKISWVDNKDADFIFRGFLSALGYTALTSCKLPGWYACPTTYFSSITDFPADFPSSGGFLLEVYNPSYSNTGTFIQQYLHDSDGNMWERRIMSGGSISKSWAKTIDVTVPSQVKNSFKFRGMIQTLEYTSLAQCLDNGWYGCPSAYLTNITDLPVGFPLNESLHLRVYKPATGRDTYLQQELSTAFSSTWKRTIKNDGTDASVWHKTQVGNVKAERPSSGYENFTFSVPVGIPDDDSGTLNLQDSADTALDRAIIILPPTYTPDGEPTRLFIVGCGTSGYIKSDSTDIASNSVFTSQIALAEGYAVMQVNGTPGATENTSHGNPFSIRSYVAAYKYVTEKYNIAKDGVLAGGYSQGSLRTLQLAISMAIPIKAVVLFAPGVDIWKINYTLFGSTIRESITENFGFVEKTAIPEVVEIFPSTAGNIVAAPSSYSSAGAVPTDAEKAYILNNVDKWSGYNPVTAKVGNANPLNIYKQWTTPDSAESSAETALYTGSVLLPCPVKIFASTGDQSCPMKWAKPYFDMLIRGGSIAELRVIDGITHNEFVTKNMNITVTAKDGNSYTVKSIVWEAMLYFRRWNI